jgi:uncharacterized membrane protein (GlpM family)
MLYHALKSTVWVQIIYTLLAAFWNISSKILITNGIPPLGPTHSLILACVLIAVSTGLYIGAKRAPLLYIGLCLFLIIGNSLAIPPVFLHDPALWLSETSRYGSALLNSVGWLASAWGVIGCWRYRRLIRAINTQSESLDTTIDQKS